MRTVRSVAAEDAMFARLEAQQRQLDMYRERASQSTAERVGAIGYEYPWVDPGVALSLGQAGMEPDEPVVRRAAGGAARRKARQSSGLGFHSIGDVVTSVGQAAASAVGEVAGFANDMLVDPARDIARVGFTVLETPLQEVQALLKASAHAEGSLLAGDVDEWMESYRQTNTSTGRIALSQLLSGERVDLGSGFLPGGEVREQFGRESSQLRTPEGESVTLGRHLARMVVEPGTKPYTALSGVVDFGVALAADPANLALGGISRTRQASKLFVPTDAGLVNGTRRTVLPETVDQWLTSKPGRETVKKLVDTDDFDALWNASNKKLGTELTARLADARSEQEVLDILRPALGVTVREKPIVARTFKPLDNVRMFQAMPGTSIDLDDADQAVEQLDRFMRNAKLPRDKIAELNGRMARASLRNERFGVLREAASATSEVLRANGVDADRARELTRFFENSMEEGRQYFVNEVGENMRVPGLVLEGERVAVASPHLPSEFINRVVPLPDARDIRRETSRFGRLLNNKAIDLPLSTVEYAQQQIWKRVVLLRGAYTVRVLGEEQFRMAGAGLDSIVNNPLAAILWSTGRRGATDVLGQNIKQASDAADNLDEFGKALSKGWAGWVADDNKIITNHYIQFNKGSEGFSAAWADELSHLRNDELARPVAQMRANLDDVKASFWDGPLAKVRRELEGGGLRLSDRRIADEYVDSVWERLRIKTSGDPDLLDAVATGQFRGGRLHMPDGRISPEFKAGLDELVDIAPDKAVGPIVAAGRQRGKGSELWDNSTTFMFSVLMGRPTNYLSRSPVFKQKYWQRAEELLPFMDDVAQEGAIRAATDAGLSNAAIRRMERTARKGLGDLTLEEADTVAKGFGLDETKALLYDMTERSQFFDIARLVFPFGEAWKEVLTRWAKIGLERPQTLRRAQQGVQGARDAGWFYPDPVTGEEVFAYPGSEWVNERLLGLPVPLTGRVAGLSLATEVLPGVGPVVQVPAGYLIPDKPEFDTVRELLFPFGERDRESGFVESFLPAWVQKFRTGFEMGDDRLYANTVMDVSRYLLSTGEYSTATAEEVDRLLRDSKERAKALYAIRGAAQFFAPSAPSPQMVAQDKDGNVMVAQVLLDDYRKMQEDDYQTATQRFLEKYGEDAMLYTQAKTSAVSVGAPVTKAGNDWVRANPDVVARYDNVYGLFAPEEGDFDFTAYNRQFESGEREGLTPEQAVRLANNRVASMVYHNAKDQVGERPTDEQAAWLREVRQALIEEYPGYQDFSGIAEKASTDTLVRELEQAAADPRLADTPLAQDLTLYFDARAQAQEAAEQQGLAGFSTAQSARHLRDWLRQIGDVLSAESPEFARTWDLMLSRELPDEEEV